MANKNDDERMSGEDTTRQLPIRDLLNKLIENKKLEENKKETGDKKKKWGWPGKWKGAMKKSSRMTDKVLIFYLNIKGELEAPIIIPLYSGNMVIVRNKVYEVDPRAFWTVRIGMGKMYKVLIIKEIDRRPVSNLDYSEIKKRGDATDSDEFLIKAALRAQIAQTTKAAGKLALIILGVLILAGVAYFFLAK